MAAAAVFTGVRPALAAYVTGDIATNAEARNGTNGGQCKAFVNSVVLNVTGKSLSGYQTGFATAGAAEVTAANAVRGDIIQITPAGSTDNTAESMMGNTASTRLHTTIIRGPRNADGTFGVIDSNWGYQGPSGWVLDQMVREHNLNPYTWAAGSIIKIWRFGAPGGGSASGASVISSLIDSSGVQHVFTGDSSGSVYDTHWGNGATLSTWQVGNNLGAAVNSISSQLIGGVLHVYAATNAGKIYDISWGNGSPLTQWMVWDTASTGDVISSQVDAGGVQHVFIGVSWGAVYDTYWGNGVPVTQWTVGNLGVSVTSLSARILNGVMHVEAASNSGKIFDISWANGSPLTQRQVRDTGSSGNVVSTFVDGGGVQHIFTGTSAGNVYDTYWGNGYALTTWQVASNLGAAVNSISSRFVGGVAHVYAATAAGSISDIYWGGGTSLTQRQVWVNGVAGDVISSQVDAGGVQHVYTGTSSGNIFDTYWTGTGAATTWTVK